MPAGDTKTCTKCGATKPLEDFRKQKDCKGGRRPDCKACCLGRERAWREQHSEQMRAYFAERYQRDKPQFAQQQRERYARNRDTILEQQKAYYQATIEARRAAGRKYAAEHREQARARARAAYRRNRQIHIERAMRRAGRIAEAPLIDRDAVLVRDGRRCGICGDPITTTDWQLDHILPLIHDGRHCWFNVQPAHAACNRQKHTRIMPRALPPISMIPTLRDR